MKYLMEEMDSKYGIDGAADDIYAFQLAAQKGQAGVIKYLLGSKQSTKFIYYYTHTNIRE